MDNKPAKKTRPVGRPPTPEAEQRKKGRFTINIAPDQAKGFLELCKILRLSHSTLGCQLILEGTMEKRRKLGMAA